MRGVVDILSAMPTVVFSGALVFVLTWWLAGFVLGGLHGHGDGHGAGHGPGHGAHGAHDAGHHAGHDAGHAHEAAHTHGHGHHAGDGHGHGHGHDGERSHLSAARAGIGDLPLSMTLLVLTFGAWATSVALTAVSRGLGSPDWGTAARVLAVAAVTAVSCAVGVAVLAGFASVAAPIFEDQSHPGKATAVGATCRVRIPPSPGRLGDAYVLTGPTARSIVRIEAHSAKESLVKGDVVLIVDFAADRDAFLVVEIDPSLVPEGG